MVPSALQASVCDEQLMSIGGEIALSGNIHIDINIFVYVQIYLYINKFVYIYVIMNRHGLNNIRNGIVWVQTGHSTCTCTVSLHVIEL